MLKMGLVKMIQDSLGEDRYSNLRMLKENMARVFRDGHADMYYQAFDYIDEMKLEGDYLEFGCFSGKTMTCAYKYANKVGLDKTRFYAFDSFEGLPELGNTDLEIPEFQKGEFKSTEQQFFKDLKQNRVDTSKVTTIKGWFHETLSKETQDKLSIRNAAVVMVDCDIYESTVPILDFIVPYLVTGTVLLFDDWFCFCASDDHGERKAVKEWLQKNSQIKLVPYLPFEGYGQSFIVNILDSDGRTLPPAEYLRENLDRPR